MARMQRAHDTVQRDVRLDNAHGVIARGVEEREHAARVTGEPTAVERLISIFRAYPFHDRVVHAMQVVTTE